LRIPLGLAFLLGIWFFSAAPTQGQQKGQYLPGQQGLNAGVLPDPGFTYANITINYSADSLKNASGNAVPLTGSYDIWAVENVFFYVPKFKVLGAKLAFMVAAPTLANGSLTLGSLAFPNVAVNAGGFGVADTWVQPVTLGWSLKRADIYAGYAFMAPTGRYTAGASDNVGSGYWGNHIITGSTVYLTKNKGTSANLFTDWELHGSKTTGAGTRATPGQTFTMEWGLGQVFPLKKFQQTVPSRSDRIRSVASQQQRGIGLSRHPGECLALLFGSCHRLPDEFYPARESHEFLLQV